MIYTHPTGANDLITINITNVDKAICMKTEHLPV